MPPHDNVHCEIMGKVEARDQNGHFPVKKYGKHKINNKTREAMEKNSNYANNIEPQAKKNILETKKGKKARPAQELIALIGKTRPRKRNHMFKPMPIGRKKDLSAIKPGWSL